MRVPDASSTRRFYEDLTAGRESRGIWGYEKRFDPNLLPQKPSVVRHFTQVVARWLQPSDAVLDMGCGPGGFLAAVAPYCGSITGVDIVPAFVEACGGPSRTGADQRAHRAVRRTAWCHPKAACSTSAIMVDTIHHCDDPGAVLDDVRRVLKPGGLLLVFEPNKANPALALMCCARPQRVGAAAAREPAGLPALLARPVRRSTPARTAACWSGPERPGRCAIADTSRPARCPPARGGSARRCSSRRRRTPVTPAAVDAAGSATRTPDPGETLGRRDDASRGLRDLRCPLRAHRGHLSLRELAGSCNAPTCAKSVQYYEALEDTAYVDSRPERLLQARRLLRRSPAPGAIATACACWTWAQAAGRSSRKRWPGVRAEGVEPSRWLSARAATRPAGPSRRAAPSRGRRASSTSSR